MQCIGEGEIFRKIYILRRIAAIPGQSLFPDQSARTAQLGALAQLPL